MGESAKIVLVIQTEDIAICKGLRNRFFSSKKMTFISKKRQKEKQSLGVLETYFRQWLQESSCACSVISVRPLNTQAPCGQGPGQSCQLLHLRIEHPVRTQVILFPQTPAVLMSTMETSPMQRHFPSKGFLGIFPKAEGPNNKGRKEKEKNSRSALRKKISGDYGKNHGRNI